MSKKKYTQKQFDSFPRDELGIKQCPSGDYSAIEKFGKWFSFGEWCSFGEGCSFGKGCSFGELFSFGEGCSYMTFVFTTVLCLYGLFRYPIILYQNKNKYIISVGCENFDSLDKAVSKSKKQNCYCEKTHRILELILTHKGE